uniref:C1q domain-containing protein n=1 Tax=Sander lucioperca TaxID=283035 RepID=A0A8D0AKS5_SANLU
MPVPCRSVCAAAMVNGEGFSTLTRKHGIKICPSFPCSVEDIGLAVGEKVGHGSIKSAARMNVQQVAFSASLLTGGQEGFTGPFTSDTTLIYKHVVTNIGNAYNSQVWTVGSWKDGEESGGWLVKNSEHVFLTYKQGSGWLTASKAATLLLEVGDVVSVCLATNTRVFDNVNHHITFSGHLLFTM